MIMKKNLLALVISITAIFSLQYTFSKINPKKYFSKDEYKLYKYTYLGKVKKAEKLIKSGVNVNIQSPNSKRSPLHFAASKGKVDFVKLLIDNGAKTETKNINGETPLHFAVKKGRADVVKYLISKGAKVTDKIRAAAKKDEIRAVLDS